jgi:hypothetical protein
MQRNTKLGRDRRRLLVALGVVLPWLCALPSVERTARAAERVTLVVFVAKDSSVKNLKMTELRRIFTNADDSGFSGKRSIPFNHTARSNDRIGFDRTVLRMTPEEVSRFWIDRKIRGLPGPPRAVDSLSQLVRLVSRTSSGMGYVRLNQLTKEQLEKEVSLITIDGKRPADPDYPLRYSE